MAVALEVKAKADMAEPDLATLHDLKARQLMGLLIGPPRVYTISIYAWKAYINANES